MVVGSDIFGNNISSSVHDYPYTSTPQTKACASWSDVQHLLYQSAHLCFVVAFLTPRTFENGTLLLRCFLTLGFLLLVIWSSIATTCSWDVVSWMFLFLIINGVYAARVANQSLPSRFSRDFYDLYEHFFLPLKIKKKCFKQLIQHAQLKTMKENESYSVEGITNISQRLSMLLKGKMKVSALDNSVILHYISPYEFVDSPEYEFCLNFEDDEAVSLSQVTITAVEECKFICWDCKQLVNDTFANNKSLESVMHNLIGKDITHKLYLLNETHRADSENARSQTKSQDRRASHEMFWMRQQMPRSASVDAVHASHRLRSGSMSQRPTQQMHSAFYVPTCSGSGMNQLEPPNGMPFQEVSLPKHAISMNVNDVDVLIPLIRVSGCSSSEIESLLD